MQDKELFHDPLHSVRCCPLWNSGLFSSCVLSVLWSVHFEVSVTNSAPVLDTLLQGGHSDPISWCPVPRGQYSPAPRPTASIFTVPLQTPWARPLIIPHTPLINACLLQQVKPFQFEEGRNYVNEQCNYSGLQPASFRWKHKDSAKHLN